MGNTIVLDIETQDTFADVGSYDPSKLSVSLVGIWRSDTDAFEVYMEDQLSDLFALMEQADCIVGFNSISFDMGCLNRYYAGDLLQIPQLDLMVKIQDVLGHRVKLDSVAHATLGIGKSGDGLDAVRYWRNGEIEKLKKYCLDDVKVTRDVYFYGRDKGFVKVPDRQGIVQDVSVDFAVQKARDAVPLTLGF